MAESAADEEPPDLFAEQEPAPAPKEEAPRCPDCRLKLDKAHTPAVHDDWSLWRREYRNQFEVMMLAWQRDLSTPLEPTMKQL